MNFPIIDGHMDSLLMLFIPGYDQRPFFEKTDIGHLDLPRAMEGGLAGGFFSIFTPHPDMNRFKDIPDNEITPKMINQVLKSVDYDLAHENTENGFKAYAEMEAQSGGRFRFVRNMADIRSAMEDRALFGIIHFEGAEAVDAELENLEGYYERGLRSIGIVWSRENVFGHGVSFQFPGSPDSGPGLTDPGKELVKACNRLGIMVDVSHLNEKGFWDVERLSSGPMVATHSCAHALVPTPRNLTDKQLDAVKASNGVVGVNYATGFIRKDGLRTTDTPLSDLVAHFRYIADRIGPDHVAMGSDFDGATIPNDIKDVAGMPKLTAALSEAGFTDDELNKITHENWLRVLSNVWKD